MKQRVLTYTGILLTVAILLLFVRLVAYDSITGYSIESLPPEQDIEGYGTDFSLSIESVDLIDSKAIVNYNLNELTGNSQKILVNIELYDDELIVSKNIDLIISGNQAKDYSNSISLSSQRVPSKIILTASGSSSYRKSTMFVQSGSSLITGSVISERRADVGLSFVIFFVFLAILFFFVKRKHLKNKAKHFASKHEDNLISVHH